MTTASNVSPKKNGQQADCSGKAWFGEEPNKPCKVCGPCNQQPNVRPDCVLFPYDSGCCPKGTDAHHLIPVRFAVLPGQRRVAWKVQKRYKGCENYNQNDAPCICLPKGRHKKVHKVFNRVEKGEGQRGAAVKGGRIRGRWTVDRAATCAGETIEEITNGKCKTDCIKAQLDAYHIDEAGMAPDTLGRADPTGQKLTSRTPSIPTAIRKPLPMPKKG